ncbi:MobH family relaxase [Burkholderia stabilis]|uniref:MobH family relaxase n=1 Tax=Burkholderia stabilis TaxID=95485 RepID=UPI001F4AD0D5|nr:MobH family relaxase [Burkholderia stabilis]
MLKKLLQRLTGRSDETSQEAPAVAPVVLQRHAASKVRVDTVASRVPVYPPIDPGIEVLPVDSIVESQSAMVARIRTVAGGTDADFSDMYLSVIRNLAEYIHLLPASRQETHTGAGGLFRLSLEMGFYCLQASEGVIFTPTEGVERRHKLEPRWRYAAFLAGVCSELHRPLASLIVSGPDGAQWPKYLLPLHRWCGEGGFDRYHISWQPEPRFETASAKGEVSAMISRIVPDRCLQYLEAGSPAIAPIVFSVATGVARDNENSVAELVARIRKRVLDRDKAVRPDYYGTMVVGNHLEPHLLEAMRTLIRDGKWKINQEGGRVWFGADGLFVIWKKAAEELSREIAQKGIQGVPTEANTLAEALLNAKVFMAKVDRDPYWKVVLPNGKEYVATKLVNPLSLLGDIELSPLPTALAGGTAASVAAPPGGSVSQMPAATPTSAVSQVAAPPQTPAPAEATSTPGEAPMPPAPAGKAPDRLNSLMQQQAQARSAMRTLDPTELGERTAEEAIAERVADGANPPAAKPDVDTATVEQASSTSATPSIAGGTQSRADSGAAQEVRGSKKARAGGNDGAAGTQKEVPPSTGGAGNRGATQKQDAPAQAKLPEPAEQAEFSYVQLLPEQFRRKLKPFLGETLGRLIADFRSGEFNDKFMLDRDGLCVSFKYAGTLGAPLPAVIEELDHLNMLYVDPSNPGKKQHHRKLPGSDKDTPCLVLASHAVQYLEIIQ